MILVYLAARFEMREALGAWRDLFRTHGIDVTSRWIGGDHDTPRAGEAEDAARRRFAEEDLDDIRVADCVVLLNPREHHRSGRGGRHVEVGYALALGKPIIIVGERENVFHWCTGVSVVSYETQLPAAIRMACAKVEARS